MKRHPFDIPMEETAQSHKDADAACGRKWECTCAACIRVREGMSKGDWLDKMAHEETQQPSRVERRGRKE